MMQTVGSIAVTVILVLLAILLYQKVQRGRGAIL
jgi:hypothetical protein